MNMSDAQAQPPAVSPNLWQTTLTENTAPTQRRTNHPVATPEQIAKEKHAGMAPTQAEKGRITRRTGIVMPSSSNMGDIPNVEKGCS